MNLKENVINIFHYCPQCGNEKTLTQSNKKIYCTECTFTYYHNTAAAAAAILEWNQKILVTIRKSPPNPGSFDLPGGFIDYSETSKEGIIREIHEELNCKINNPLYLFSFPNEYFYKNILYHTIDFFYYFQFHEKPKIKARDDITNYLWIDIHEIKIENFPFQSIKSALKTFLNSRLRINELSPDVSF